MGLSVVMFPPSNFQYVNTCQWHLLLESESLDRITRKEKQPFIGLLKQWEASLEASNCPLCQWMETACLRMKPTLRRVGLRWKKLPDMVWTPALIHAFIHCYPSVSSYSLSVKSVWAGPLWLTTVRAITECLERTAGLLRCSFPKNWDLWNCPPCVTGSNAEQRGGS